MTRADDALREIKAFIAEHGYPPTVRELAAALGVSSSASAFRLLTELQKAGKVDWNPRHGRTLRVLSDEFRE